MIYSSVNKEFLVRDLSALSLSQKSFLVTWLKSLWKVMFQWHPSLPRVHFFGEQEVGIKIECFTDQDLLYLRLIKHPFPLMSYFREHFPPRILRTFILISDDRCSTFSFSHYFCSGPVYLWSFITNFWENITIEHLLRIQVH